MNYLIHFLALHWFLAGTYWISRGWTVADELAHENAVP